MNKKASFQLSINFLVVMIICLVLLGIGIKLISDFVIYADKWDTTVNKYYEEQLKKALDSGELVAVFPGHKTCNRGELAEFGVGIRNELEATTDFYISLEFDDYTYLGEKPEPIFIRGPYPVENNEKTSIRVGLKTSKEVPKDTYIYNVYICKKDVDCDETEWEQFGYGPLQKIQVNVK
ncbi:hypothetical protein AYK26_05775 [Euryarchaeota archaeon SM23-78]|nr:MAG: hypothetical protein AYK26_05775 [Euryarchaeota archaeon SM23-78]MBW3000982.1 hypothetical protein [Candidatus Woesearchaeota archaeon]